MIEQNPDHPNGTCEACGGPCAVYGCRFCPECYWPATLAERRTDPRPAAQHVAAFRRLHLGEPYTSPAPVTNRKEPAP